MNTKDIFFFGAGLAVAMGYLYFTSNPNALSSVQNLVSGATSGGTPSTTPQPTSTTPPPTTVNSGTTTVNNPSTSPSTTPVAPATPIASPIAAPIVAPAPAPSVNPATMPVAQVAPPIQSASVVAASVVAAPVVAMPVSVPADVFYTNTIQVPPSDIGQGGNVGSGTVNPLGYGGNTNVVNTYEPAMANVANPDAMHLSAGGNNVGLFNDPSVLKRPVFNQTVNSLYKEPAFMYEFSPIAN